MCRLAAFPPGFEPNHAIKILERFSKGNGDGTGSAYVKNGKFVVNKWPSSFYKVINNEYPLLEHMPYNGWTIVHLRSATHGENTVENTHPFIKNEWAVAHNGIWSEYELVQASLKGLVKFEGETDSEVAAHLLATIGPKKFTKLIDFGGVFLALNLNGELWAIKTSGELEVAETNYGIVLASSLPGKFLGEEQDEGWLKFDANGKFIDRKQIKYTFKSPVGVFYPPGAIEVDEKVKLPW